jgi:hypothetical protein
VEVPHLERLTRRFDRIDSHLERIDTRLAGLDGRLESLHRMMVRAFVAISAAMVAGFAGVMGLLATQL